MSKVEHKYDSMFRYNDGKVLISFIPRERKNVMVVSTLHKDDAIEPASGRQKKPEVITFYNSTKSGVQQS